MENRFQVLRDFRIILLSILIVLIFDNIAQAQVQAYIGKQFIAGQVTDSYIPYKDYGPNPDIHNPNVHYVFIPNLSLYVDGSGSGPGIKVPDYYGSQHYGYTRVAPLGDVHQEYTLTSNNSSQAFHNAFTFTFFPSSADVGNPASVQEIMTGNGSNNDGQGVIPKPDEFFNTFTITVEQPQFINTASLENLCQSSPVLQIADFFSGNTNLSQPVSFYLDNVPSSNQAVTSIDPGKLTPGSHTLTAYKEYDNGTFQLTIPINVIATTPITFGPYPKTVCANQGIFTITASPSGGTWSSSSGAVDASGNVDPSKASAGALILTYSYTDPNKNTNPSGCASTQIVNIEVTQPPGVVSFSGTTSGCSGIQTMLSAHVDGAISYNWYHLTDAAPFATGATIAYTIVSTEQLYCVGIGQNGCGLPRNQAGSIQLTSLSPTANPTASEYSIPFGGIVNFKSNSPYNTSVYSWDFGDGEKSSEPNPSHYFYHSGSYTVKLFISSPQGCSSTLTLNSIKVSSEDSSKTSLGSPRPTGTDSLPTTVRIFPSPFQDHIYLGVKLSHPQTIQYQIMDLNGRMVRQGVLMGEGGDNKLKIEGLASLGIRNYYLLILRSEEVNEVDKILKL